MAVSNRDVCLVQVAYPQIYFACHTRHFRRASTPSRLSATDSTLLAHLDEDQPVRPTVLAKHLGLAASTLSAAITRLAAQGYVVQRTPTGAPPSGGCRRRAPTQMQASSVLDRTRVARMLTRLSTRERRDALAGLALLAQPAPASQGGAS